MLNAAMFENYNFSGNFFLTASVPLSIVFANFSSFPLSTSRATQVGIAIKGLKICLRHSISAVNLFFTYIFRESFLFRWTVHSLDSKVFIFADIFIAPSCPVSRHKTENRHTIIHSKEIDTPNLLKGMGFLMACQAIFHGAMVIRFTRRLIPSGWN